MLDALRHTLILSMPGMPPEAWWVALLALLALGIAAAIDAFKGIVPDPIIFFGMIGIVAARGIATTWPDSAHQMTWGLVAAAIVWGVNEGWNRVFRHDALGMGDAKWTMLAVTCFGALPALFAWGVGALLGSIWIAAQKIARRGTIHVHFAPFLFAGLLAGLWAVRFDGFKTLLAAVNPS